MRMIAIRQSEMLSRVLIKFSINMFLYAPNSPTGYPCVFSLNKQVNVKMIGVFEFHRQLLNTKQRGISDKRYLKA